MLFLECLSISIHFPHLLVKLRLLDPELFRLLQQLLAHLINLFLVVLTLLFHFFFEVRNLIPQLFDSLLESLLFLSKILFKLSSFLIEFSNSLGVIVFLIRHFLVLFLD